MTTSTARVVDPVPADSQRLPGATVRWYGTGQAAEGIKNALRAGIRSIEWTVAPQAARIQKRTTTWTSCQPSLRRVNTPP